MWVGKGRGKEEGGKKKRRSRRRKRERRGKEIKADRRRKGMRSTLKRLHPTYKVVWKTVTFVHYSV